MIIRNTWIIKVGENAVETLWKIFNVTDHNICTRYVGIVIAAELYGRRRHHNNKLFKRSPSAHRFGPKTRRPLASKLLEDAFVFGRLTPTPGQLRWLFFVLVAVPQSDVCRKSRVRQPKSGPLCSFEIDCERSRIQIAPCRYGQVLVRILQS